MNSPARIRSAHSSQPSSENALSPAHSRLGPNCSCEGVAESAWPTEHAAARQHGGATSTAQNRLGPVRSHSARSLSLLTLRLGSAQQHAAQNVPSTRSLLGLVQRISLELVLNDVAEREITIFLSLASIRLARVLSPSHMHAFRNAAAPVRLGDLASTSCKRWP